jgi:choline kinase
MRNNAESISIIINEQQPDTLTLLKKLQEKYPLNIVVKNTTSSMHSMYALSPYLKKGKFCLTTVDTIFHEKEFERYIREYSREN